MIRPSSLQEKHAIDISSLAIGGLVAVAYCTAPTIAAEPSIRIYEHLPVLRPDFPVPPASKSRLAYLQRSQNANAVIYEVRKTPDGKIDPKNPVRIRWRRYASDGAWRPLSRIERWVFGVKTRAIGTNHGQFKITFKLLPSRVGMLHLDQGGKPVVHLKIGNRRGRLIYIYIKLKRRLFLPAVEHVDIVGQALGSGKFLVERIYPAGGGRRPAIDPDR